MIEFTNLCHYPVIVYCYDLCLALTFAQRALCAAAILRLAATERVRRFGAASEVVMLLLIPRTSNRSQGPNSSVQAISFLSKLLNNTFNVCHR